VSAEDTAAGDDVIDAAEEAAPAVAEPRRRSPMAALRRHLGAVVLVVALVASAGAAAAVYFAQYRQDRATDAAATGAALEAAKTGTVALLSYSPDSLDKDFAAAKSHLTGEFLSYYTDYNT
jgi:Mce-associated membrane protein